MTDDRTPDGKGQAADEKVQANEANADSMQNAVGAYLLDALPADERAAFEAFLVTSPETRSEVRELAPVVALLPNLLAYGAGAGEIPAPAPEQREHLLAAAIAGGQPSPTPSASHSDGAATIRPISRASAAAGSRRPQGRIRSGVESAPEAPTLVRLSRRLPTSWLAAAVVTLVAIGAILWALALQSRIDSKNREITAQSAQISRLMQTTNATAYTLSADATGSGRAGTLLFSLKDQIGVLYVRDLPQLDPGKVYQLWYLDDQTPQSPRPGGTFSVDQHGNGFVAVAPDTPTFDGVALTSEPTGGSKAPTSAIVLQGRLGGAAG